MNRRRFFAAVVGGSVAPKVGTLGRLTQPERVAALAGMIHSAMQQMTTHNNQWIIPPRGAGNMARSLLLFHRAPLAIGEPRESSCENGNEARVDGTPPVDRIPPILRRFLFAICSGLLLIPCCHYGRQCIINGSIFWGRAIVGGAFLFFWSSLLLIFLTGFRWSWGWPL